MRDNCRECRPPYVVLSAEWENSGGGGGETEEEERGLDGVKSSGYGRRGLRDR